MATQDPQGSLRPCVHRPFPRTLPTWLDVPHPPTVTPVTTPLSRSWGGVLGYPGRPSTRKESTSYLRGDRLVPGSVRPSTTCVPGVHPSLRPVRLWGTPVLRPTRLWGTPVLRPSVLRPAHP